MLSDSLKERMLAADIFEVKQQAGKIEKLWQNAKDIEITFDFLEPKGFIGKIFNNFIKKTKV
jgi:hypothetical protein